LLVLWGAIVFLRGRPAWSLALDGDEAMTPDEVRFRCAYSYVGVTASGQFISMLGPVAKDPEQ
jgi:hypothetical protein